MFQIGKSAESEDSQMFFKISVLKNFSILTGKNLFWSLLLLELEAFSPAILLIRDSNTVFFCKCCEIFKNNFFYGTPPAAAFIKSRIGNYTENLREQQVNSFKRRQKKSNYPEDYKVFNACQGYQYKYNCISELSIKFFRKRKRTEQERHMLTYTSEF